MMEKYEAEAYYEAEFQISHCDDKGNLADRLPLHNFIEECQGDIGSSGTDGEIYDVEFFIEFATADKAFEWKCQAKEKLCQIYPEIKILLGIWVYDLDEHSERTYLELTKIEDKVCFFSESCFGEDHLLMPNQLYASKN